MNSFIKTKFSMSILAPAKLNLNLLITGIALNGLHLLNSHVCFLELNDQIHIKNSKRDLFKQITVNKKLLINNKNNLILDALKAFRAYTGIEDKFEISLNKNIPLGAGLGGGSADAAAVLLLLRLFNNNIKKSKIKVSINDLISLAQDIGSDVPACVMSKSLTLKGFGEKLSNIDTPDGYFFLLINPNIILSTKTVFSQYQISNLDNVFKSPNFENIKIFNSLLNSASYIEPSISKILINLKNYKNILTFGMTGSGSTCFGIFKNKLDLKHCMNIIKEDNKTDFYFWYGKKVEYGINRVFPSNSLDKFK